MKDNKHPTQKLLKLIKKNGIKCLLPQNLTDEILHRMIREADAIDNDSTEETPSSTLLIAILHLESKSIMKKGMKIKIAPEKLMEYFSFYITSIRLEEKRRKQEIFITEESLPTIENIFDKNRTMDIMGID
ncbi:MAG TPA: hypothetical protein ENK99_07300 [Campylobacterales bacterium]|nr:hypothetical protein [Campylobacterales bacterium]